MGLNMIKIKLLIILFLASVLVVSSITISGEKIEISGLESPPVIVEFFTTSDNNDGAYTSEQIYQYYSDIYPYNSEEPDFYYMTFLTDTISHAKKRANEIGVTDYPFVSVDGGYREFEGKKDLSVYIDAISESKNRDHAEININVKADWSQCPCHQEINTVINIDNPLETEYRGRLLVYVAMIDSRWTDEKNRPFNYVVVGTVTDEEIVIGTGTQGLFINDYMWGDYNYVKVDNGNIYNFVVIATVFSEETGFLDVLDVDRLLSGDQPKKPNIQGPTTGTKGESYSYFISSTDTDNDKIKYIIDWDGNYKLFEYTDYYESGDEIEVSNIWEKTGSFDIRVKAKDEEGIESFWSDPLPVSVPKNQNMNKFSNIILLEWLLERFPPLEKLINIIWR